MSKGNVHAHLYIFLKINFNSVKFCEVSKTWFVAVQGDNYEKILSFCAQEGCLLFLSRLPVSYSHCIICIIIMTEIKTCQEKHQNNHRFNDTLLDLLMFALYAICFVIFRAEKESLFGICTQMHSVSLLSSNIAIIKFL